MQGQPAQLHEDFANNVALQVPAGTGVSAGTLEIEDDTAIDEAFANAEVTISQRMVNQRLIPTAIEPRGVVAHWEPGKDELTMGSSTQIPHRARLLIGVALGLGQHQVRVIAPEVGGGFGSKLGVYAKEHVTCAISRQPGRPVKWIEDRSEAFIATTHGRDIIAYVAVAAKRDGAIRGFKFRLIQDIGASSSGQGHETTFSQMLADTFRIPIEDVTILHGDTGVVRQGLGTFGSRSQAVGGTALKLAAGKVQAKPPRSAPRPAS